MTPVEVGPHNADIVRARLYPSKPKSHKWNYNAGDRVRIVLQHRPFHKGYLGDWSEEIFEILSRVPVTYELKDLSGEGIKGRFYEPEVQKVLKTDDEHFDVNKILKTRKRSGKIQYFVSWKGCPDKFNSWVSELSPR